mmetsp:Transcript_19597/g.32409  ORF Transcript_19597/g.32409 Transcript_19597/m.32409 type:complete len:181 (-) Transcript_19597:205-747(-)
MLINTAFCNMTTEPPSTTEGCYLSYLSDSGGKLELQYSRTPVDKAVGFWTAGHGKKIQGFKFNQNAGRQELIKGIAGGDSNKKKYHSGVCQFVKEAKKFKGWVLMHHPIAQGIDVDVYVYRRDGSRMAKLDFSGATLHDVSDIDAVTCVPRDSDVYKGVKNIDIGTFLNKGTQKGCCTSL